MSPTAASPLSRPPARSPDTWGGVVAAMFFGGWFSVMPLLGIRSTVGSFVEEQRLREAGVTTAAVVVARRHQSDSDGDSYFFTLAYDAPSGPGERLRSFRREVSVGADFYNAVRDGRAVPLRSLPTDPAVSRLAEGASFAGIVGAGFVFAMLGFFLVLGVLIVLGGLESGRTLLRLAWFGRRVPGRVVERWVQTDHEENPKYCLSYRFQPPNGPAQLAAEINARAYRRLEPGSEVPVEYLPRRPAICRLVLR